MYELLRFGLVGVISNLVYFGALGALRGGLGLRWGLSAGMSYLLSMAANYLLQRGYTFRSRASHSHAGRRYIVAQLVALGLNSGLLEVLLELRVLDVLLGSDLAAVVLQPPVLPEIPLRFVVGQGVALIVTIAWNYLALKFWVFREDGSPAREGVATVGYHEGRTDSDE